MPKISSIRHLIDQNEAEIVRFRTFRFLRLRLLFPDGLNRAGSLSGPLDRLTRLGANGALNQLYQVLSNFLTSPLMICGLHYKHITIVNDYSSHLNDVPS